MSLSEIKRERETSLKLSRLIKLLKVEAKKRQSKKVLSKLLTSLTSFEVYQMIRAKRQVKASFMHQKVFFK